MPPWTVSKFPLVAQPLGYNLSASKGIVFSGTTTGVKSSYSEITPSTPWDADGFYLFFGPDLLGTNTQTFRIDIAAGGAGNEIPIIWDIPMIARRGAGNVAFFPINVPAGTRLTARCATYQEAANPRGATVALTLMPRTYTASNMNRNNIAVTYGFDANVIFGSDIDPGGTANTYGAYTQITASTAHPIRQLIMFCNQHNNASTSAAKFRLQLAVGANGSEQTLIPDIALGNLTGSDGIVPTVVGPIPVKIPSETRVAVRAMCNITSVVDRHFDFSMIGIC